MLLAVDVPLTVSVACSMEVFNRWNISLIYPIEKGLRAYDTVAPNMQGITKEQSVKIEKKFSNAKGFKSHNFSSLEIKHIVRSDADSDALERSLKCSLHLSWYLHGAKHSFSLKWEIKSQGSVPDPSMRRPLNVSPPPFDIMFLRSSMTAECFKYASSSNVDRIVPSYGGMSAILTDTEKGYFCLASKLLRRNDATKWFPLQNENGLFWLHRKMRFFCKVLFGQILQRSEFSLLYAFFWKSL